MIKKSQVNKSKKILFNLPWG